VATGTDLVGIGQCALDQVAEIDGLPRFAGKQRIRVWTEQPGGQVATALLAARRLGLSAALVGRVGEDAAADAVLAPLAAAAIDLSEVQRVPGARTQSAMILVDRASGERTVLWYRDARLALSAEDVPLDLVRRARALLIDAGDPAASLAGARAARDAGIPVLLDADTDDPGLGELFAAVDYPILSEELAAARFGGIEAALDALIAAGARGAVVTIGRGGCVAREGETRLQLPAFDVPVVDTTGAGDVFHGSFAVGLLEGRSLAANLRRCNAAAGLACGALGAQGALPDRDTLDAFLASDPPPPDDVARR
jgi:sugar/nucleoside kinase (ribokinase family)